MKQFEHHVPGRIGEQIFLEEMPAQAPGADDRHDELRIDGLQVLSPDILIFGLRREPRQCSGDAPDPIAQPQQMFGLGLQNKLTAVQIPEKTWLSRARHTCLPCGRMSGQFRIHSGYIVSRTGNATSARPSD